MVNNNLLDNIFKSVDSLPPKERGKELKKDIDWMPTIVIYYYIIRPIIHGFSWVFKGHKHER